MMRFFLTIVIAVWPLASDAQGQKAEGAKWEFSHRFQTGWEYDTNIYETSAERTTSGSTRFLLNTSGGRRDIPWQIQYFYSAGLQAYSGHSDENKLTHDLGCHLGLRLKPWLQVSTRANAYLKLYLENGTDYGATSGALIPSVLLPKRITLDFVLETGQLDYAATDLYDFTFRGIGLTIRRPLLPKASIEAIISRRYLNYPRRSVACIDPSQVPAQGEDQRDRLTTLQLMMGFGGKISSQVAMELQTNRSTNLVYDFNRVRVSGLIGFRPARRWMVRAAALLQHKNYLTPLPPLCVIELDTEREQSNFIVVDISRDLSQALSLITRATLYDNESTVRGYFYRKLLYFAGLEIRL
jgi:hypothetical protein